VKKAYAKAIPAPWRRVASIFAALGDPHRQRMLLLFEPREKLSIAQIVDASSLSRSAVAHHLRILQEAGVLRREKVGKEVHFWPDIDSVRNALAAVEDYLRDMQAGR
jgi:ArsR family transcriptional regulator